MAICCLSLLLLSVLLCSKDGSSLPHWLRQRKSHTALLYNDQQLAALCARNSRKRINRYLDHILIPRPVGSANHSKVLEYLKNVTEALGFEIRIHRFNESTVVGEKRFANLIATINPMAPRRLTLACHYDSKDFSYLRSGGAFEGAIDSAVPCALLLDVAETLSPYFHAGIPNELSLQLMFLDGEEAFRDWSEHDSLYGSRKLAAELAAHAYPTYGPPSITEIRRIDVLVLLDLLGARDCHIYNYMINDKRIYEYLPDSEERLKEIEGCLPLTRQIFHRGTLPQYAVDDDHRPFMLHRVPVVHVIPAHFPPVWHTLRDTRKAIDFPTVDRLAAVLRVFVARYLRLAI